MLKLIFYEWVSDDANQNGYFEGYEDGVFSPSMFGGQDVEVTYTVDSSTACVEGEDSVTFTVTVEQGADAGEDMDPTVCSSDDVQDLYTLISAEADTDGEFTLDGDVITDGQMDPSGFEPGTYEVIYTVTADEDQCGGDDTATLNITVTETPEAPTGTDATFCAVEGATADELQVEGDDNATFMWYADADLTTMVNAEDLLEDGEYYVTQTVGEGCESEAAVVTVTINDSDAPTTGTNNPEFCEADNPTIADLDVDTDGEITWYDSADGDNALGTSTSLTNGTTYYATNTGTDTGCESSERLAVTVTVETCELIFPEAITPNGDGRNDNFVIENIESEYPDYNIEIFNRWGNVIYKGNASTPAWDGTSNQSGSLGDDILPVGVYFYVVDFNDGSTEPHQGKVYLSR